MKKIFFALAALVLAFTGCSQEEDAIQVSEKKAVKVVVNMDKPGFGEDTRAARTKWEDGDQVIGTIGSPGTGIRLTYDADLDSWTTEILKVSGTNYIPADFDEMLATGTGDVMAAYFSSGIYSLAFVEPNPPTTTLPTMAIITNASCGFDKFGECVMTCDNGTYEVEETADGYVLTLNITMVPQVAQFTIRGLDIADGWNISMGDYSPINMYAGGAITTEGVDLTLIDALYCYPHQNGNDISIFAAPWQSNADIPRTLWDTLSPEEQADDEHYCSTETYYYEFTVYNDTYWLVREFDYKEVAIGGAVIMDGPYTEDEDGNKTEGAQEWI